MKRINFIAILLLIFTLSFIYIENIKALEEEPTIEEEEKMANERIQEQEYYFKEDLTTPVINIYKEIDGNGNINYKYEILNEKVINTGFNIFYNENGQIFKFYLFDNNEIAHSLTKINNKYYTFNEEGKMLYGWQTINNKKYYFSILTGEAYIGIKTINNKTYYFSNNGQLLTGIYKVNGYIYYFTSNGIQTGLKKVNNKYYYFDNKGHAIKGFKTINKKLYFFNENGISITGIIKSRNNYYCLKNYKLIKNKWIKTSKKNYYYFDKNGKAFKGWHRIGLTKYYFNKDGTRAKGLTKIGKYTYYFNSKGKMKKGLITINKTKYYFNSKGHMYGGLKTIKNKIYYFSTKNGKSTTGLVYSKGHYYYLTNYKFVKSKWKKVNNKYYRFNKNGVAYKNTIQKINKVYYKFNSNSEAINGYYTLNNNTYYKDAKGKNLTGVKFVFGSKKLFGTDGILVNETKIMDVSEFQGKIDWEKVKLESYVQGAILRIGFTGSESKKNVEDAWFKNYIENVKKYNIPIGIYYYGNSTTIEEATKEANFIIETLKKYGNPTLKYPIFYDAEIKKVGKKNYENVIPTFASILQSYGYKVGVYGNANAFYSTNGYLNSSIIKKYPMWVAHYNTLCSSHYVSETYCGYKNAYGWQYTSSATIPGVKTRVDVSNWYRY